MAVFFSACEKCYRKSCKYMRNKSTQHKGKKTSNSQYQSFEHNGIKIYDQQRLESLALKRKGGAHADMMSEGFGNFIAKGDRQANSRDVNPLETIWIIVDEKTYKEPAPK